MQKKKNRENFEKKIVSGQGEGKKEVIVRVNLGWAITNAWGTWGTLDEQLPSVRDKLCVAPNSSERLRTAPKRRRRGGGEGGYREGQFRIGDDRGIGHMGRLGRAIAQRAR